MNTPPITVSAFISLLNPNVLDYFVHGGFGYNEGKSVDFHKLSISPYVADPSLNSL